MTDTDNPDDGQAPNVVRLTDWERGVVFDGVLPTLSADLKVWLDEDQRCIGCAGETGDCCHLGGTDG